MLTDKSDELSWSLSRNGSSTGQTIGERFLDTSQESKMSTSVGGVFTGRGADMIILDEILKPDTPVRNEAPGGKRLVLQYVLESAEKQEY